MSRGGDDRAVVLLAAGRGSRMGELTAGTPKPLLPVGGVPLLDRVLDAVLQRTQGEIRVVTGYLGERIAALVAARGPGRITCVDNPRFDDDVNIGSVHLGVESLAHPERGYTIVETDLLLDSSAWDRVFEGHRGRDSFWVTRGRYGPGLTGGIAHADADGRIDAIAYRPVHDVAFDGWHKLVGILSVAPTEVSEDRRLRGIALSGSTRQYYLKPWSEHLDVLPCRLLDLGDRFAASFNTPEDLAAAEETFLELERSAKEGRCPSS